MATNAIKTLSEDFVHCNVCQELYNEPRLLPCLHSFCLRCLEQWANNCQDQGLTCPTCRCVVDLPNTGVQGLPKNFFLVSLMERLEEASRLATQHQDFNCSICRNKMGTRFCLDCKMHICQDCKETHDRLTRSSDHPLIPSEKISDERFLQEILSSQSPYCNTHKQEKVRYFCTQCSEIACQVCATVSHQGHQSLQEVGSIVISTKVELEKLLEESESNASDARRNLAMANRANEILNHTMSDLLGEIDDRYHTIVTKLKSDKEKLEEELQGFFDKQCAPVKTFEKSVADWLKAMENTQEMTRTIIQQNNSRDILEMKSKLVDSLTRLNRYQQNRFPSQARPQETVDPLVSYFRRHMGNFERRESKFPRVEKLKFHPAQLGVISEYEKRKTTERTASENLFRDNFLGYIVSAGYHDTDWLFPT